MRSKLFSVICVVAMAGMLLAACAPAPTAAPTAAPAATQASAATTAPVATKAPDATKPPAPTAVPTAATVNTLRVNVSSGTYPDNLDPQQMSFINEIGHAHLVYVGLMALDKDLKTVPGSAESVKINTDATEFTFTIRKGLKYSDGSLLNAKRFEYSIIRNINPKTAGQYAGITNDIKNAEAWQTADLAKTSADDLKKLEDAVRTSVRALDSANKPCTGYDQADCLTLVIDTAAPAPYFTTVMTLWVTYPAKQELIEKGGDKWWLDVKNQIGNGAFIWTANEQNVKSEFVPNPNYFGGVPKYNVEYRYIVDSATAFKAYQNGELDVIGLAAEDLKVAQADPALKQEIVQYPGSCTYAVMFHQLKAPFTDEKVREAFAYALDRKAWVTDILKGLGAPTLTWIPKGYPGYDGAENRWGFDAAKAKQAIADSTYKSVDKLPPITLTYSDSPRNKTRYEWLAAQFKANLGVDVKLAPTEPTAYTALVKDVKTAPQMFILGWCADYPDPQNWLSVYWNSTTSFAARIGYANKDLDAMMKQADIELDPAKRMQLYADAQKKLTDGAPVAFMWNSVNTYLVKPYVKGYNVTPQDYEFPGDNVALNVTVGKP